MQVGTYANLMKDVLLNPHTERPQDESKIGKIAQQYT